MKSDGKVYLVGAGPGDPNLITKRGHDLLERADVIVLDALVDPSLAQNFSSAKIIHAGKRGPGAESGAAVHIKQDRINRLLVQHARAGQLVVRLKGGDPFVFGRGTEELEFLKKNGVRFEVVPGVSSATGVPATAGIPLTDRRWASQVTILTGHEGSGEGPGLDWARLSPQGTLVILMGVSSWPGIRRRLEKQGWPMKKPVAAVEWGGTPRQRTILTTLEASQAEFRKQKLVAPAIIVVGEVARFSSKLAWWKREKPLLGKRIVVTRAYDKNEDLAFLLADKGAQVIVSPAIRVEPVADDAAWTNFRGKKYDGVIFLSANGVRAFRLLSSDINSAAKKIPVVAVGPKTALEARRSGWNVRKTAKTYNARGVARILGRVKGKRYLLPRVENGPRDLVETLLRRGAVVDEVSTYRTLPVQPTVEARHAVMTGVDAVTFTSGSTARYFLEAFSPAEKKKIFRNAVAVSIGPMTSSAIKERGVTRILEARPSTVEGMVAALTRRFKNP